MTQFSVSTQLISLNSAWLDANEKRFINFNKQLPRNLVYSRKMADINSRSMEFIDSYCLYEFSVDRIYSSFLVGIIISHFQN